MISLFKQFLIRLAINFLQANNYEICSKELTPGEMAFLLKIFEGK